MRDELYSKLGFYNSAFIKMHVHCTEDLSDITKLSMHSEATYFHEYIHFLQDITTSYGLMNISTIVDYIKATNLEARADGQIDFNVPFYPIASTVDDVKANWELKSIYLGGGNGHNDIAKVNSVYKRAHPVQTKNGWIHPEKLILDYDDSKGNNYKTVIGAHCIAESMAFMMEQILYPGILPPADKLPYESIRFICDFIHPLFSLDPLNIIALCDACMMFFNPGHFLFEAITEMAQNNYIPQVPDDIYNHIYSKINFQYNGCNNANSLCTYTSGLASQQFKDYFTTPTFKDNKDWIDDIFSKALQLRLASPNFMLDLVRNGKLVVNGKISNIEYKNLYDLLGTPIIVNDNYELFFQAPAGTTFNLRYKYLWVINQVYKIYRNGLNQGTHRCEMIDWCDARALKKNIPSFTTADCRYSPWVRASETQPNDCAFSRLWYTWEMLNEHPK